ncbi:hypothetical protein R1sor_026378 [Riccia sorocarpa]|uniref:Reverse transcriptase domain-containing protein n=1 Tax=Riccia sorocarpa TaxID=122646 RepID=A0ABD3GEB4_9MARC
MAASWILSKHRAWWTRTFYCRYRREQFKASESHQQPNLYADDTGIFLQMDHGTFTTILNTLRSFEQASGARLNLNKNIIIPMGDGQIP